MRDDIFREDFIHRLSKALDTESTVLKREIVRGGVRSREYTHARSTRGISPEHEVGTPAGVPRGLQTELYLLLLILSNPQYLELATPRLDEGYFHGKWTKKLWRTITRTAERGGWDSSTVFSSLEDDQFVKYLSGKLLEEILDNNPKEQLIDTIATLKEIRLKEKLARVTRELRKAELEKDETRETDLLVEKNALTNELKKIEQLRASKIRL
jgi:hypothetical protein